MERLDKLEGLGRTSPQTFQCSIYEVIKQDDDLHESDSRDCPNINNFWTHVLCFCKLQIQDGPTHFSSLGLFGCLQQSIKGPEHQNLGDVGGGGDLRLSK